MKLRLISSLLIQVSFPFKLCSWTTSHAFFLFQTPSQLCLLCCYHLFTIMLYIGWVGYSSCDWRLISSAYLAASLTKELLPNFSALSSNSRTVAITGSLFLYSFTAAVIFVTLYSSLIDCSPLPPFTLGMYRIAIEPLECLPPFSTNILRASLSNLLSYITGRCCVLL